VADIKSKNSIKGVTLIEVIMAIVVVGALVGGVALFVTQAINIWKFVVIRNDQLGQGRVALDRMVKEIRLLKDSYSVTTAASDDFNFTAFYDYDGDGTSDDVNVQFVISGTELFRNSDILCDSVATLQFEYYDVDNNLLGSPQVSPSETDIWRINITLTIDSGEEAITLYSQVHPRNI